MGSPIFDTGLKTGFGLSRDAVAGFTRPPLRTNYWSGLRATAVANNAMAANTLYAGLWVCEETCLYDQMGIYVTSGVAGSIKLGVFAFDPDLVFGAPLAEINTDISAATPGALTASLAAPVRLTAGETYLLASISDAAPTVRGYSPTAVQGGGFSWLFGAATGGKWADVTGNYVALKAALTYVTGSPFFGGSLGPWSIGAGAPGAPITFIRKA